MIVFLCQHIQVNWGNVVSVQTRVLNPKETVKGKISDMQASIRVGIIPNLPNISLAYEAVQ